MIILNNYLFSFGIAEHFPSNTDNITKRPTRVTAKGVLNATPLHYRSHTYVSLHQAISISAYTLYAHISCIGITDYHYIILHIYCHIINDIGVMID